MMVSVALCTYNAGAYLEPQLQSIVDQTRPPDEIVVSDDGSTDGTRDRLRSFAAAHPDTVTVIENDRQLGVTKNFEQCIAACSGSVIALSDQDDIWDETKLETQLDAYRATPDARLVCHDSELLFEDADTPATTLWETIHDSHEPESALEPTAAISELLGRNFVQGATALFDAALRSVALPIPPSWNHDAYLAFWAAMTGGLVDIGDRLLTYRIHESQDIGVASGIRQKVDRELSYPTEHYLSLAERWSPLLDAIDAVDSDALVVDETWLRRVIERRQRYDRRRAQIHSPERSLGTRFGKLVLTLLSGGYTRFGHVGLAGTDAVALLTDPFGRQ
ncbi:MULTISPECIES: glycosyltransferase [Haloarcula]|uniref:Glycosyl transferase n=1 Tax=Haloarcula pellucida TaxID=1427151 RepID=A0A830GK73_9EURY|nr:MULTISPECIES: glycosyltransferase [Halomicroarcula]MBX0348739.1 glycosyltransferase [Halomicroarcula pellucida]MDS0278507.1 glycosyltransferase [Halomicroarcula sp. S1AR25-4]GGN91999.1 glycosyl transferase [Halomicroarcula pellucida]